MPYEPYYGRPPKEERNRTKILIVIALSVCAGFLIGFAVRVLTEPVISVNTTTTTTTTTSTVAATTTTTLMAGVVKQGFGISDSAKAFKDSPRSQNVAPSFGTAVAANFTAHAPQNFSVDIGEGVGVATPGG